MSFILDALKKSEIERQRQSIPGLVDSGIARPRPRLPMWAIALGALLAVNLIVLLFVLTRGWMRTPPAPPVYSSAPPRRAAPSAGPGAEMDGTTVRGGPSPSSEARGGPSQGDEARNGLAPDGDAGSDLPPGGTQATSSAHFSPLDTAPVYAPEIPVTSGPMPPTVVPRAGSPESPVAHTLHRRDPLLTDEDYKSDDEELLPSINEINLTGAQALPDLHLDVHVYATRSVDRFVYVNMRKYHEGAVLQEGPTVERIRRDGVVLNYHALRFLLPRQ